MSRNSIVQGPSDEEFTALKNLKAGDKVYTGEYAWDAATESGGIKVHEFLFRKYVDKKNHTEIPFEEGVIPAILYTEKSPSVDVPQDLSTSFYLTPRSAVESFRGAITEILEACDEWLISNQC
jgi:hypothetical protein